MATPPPTAEVVEFQAQPQRIRPDTTIGRAGLKHYGGVLTEEFLTSLQGPRGIRTFNEMSRERCRDRRVSLRDHVDPERGRMAR